MVFRIKYLSRIHSACIEAVISRSLDNIEECSILFSFLNGIATLTSNSIERTYALIEYLKR
jgi:hypothetical protein